MFKELVVHVNAEFKNLIKESRDDKLDGLVKVILKWVLRLCYALKPQS